MTNEEATIKRSELLQRAFNTAADIFKDIIQRIKKSKKSETEIIENLQTNVVNNSNVLLEEVNRFKKAINSEANLEEIGVIDNEINESILRFSDTYNLCKSFLAFLDEISDKIDHKMYRSAKITNDNEYLFSCN